MSTLAASWANQDRQNIEDQRREDENAAALTTARNERLMRELNDLQLEHEQTGTAALLAAADLAAAEAGLQSYGNELERLAQLGREAAIAQRELALAAERSSIVGRMPSIARAGRDEGAAGGVLQEATVKLNESLTNLDLRVSLFGETTQTAQERVRLHEQALIELAAEYGVTSPLLRDVKDAPDAERDALDACKGLKED